MTFRLALFAALHAGHCGADPGASTSASLPAAQTRSDALIGEVAAEENPYDLHATVVPRRFEYEDSKWVPAETIVAKGQSLPHVEEIPKVRPGNGAAREGAHLRGIQHENSVSQFTSSAELTTGVLGEPALWDRDTDADYSEIRAETNRDAAKENEDLLADDKGSGLASILSWLWETVPIADEEKLPVAQGENQVSEPPSSEPDPEWLLSSETFVAHEGHALAPNSRFYNEEELRNALGSAFDPELFHKVANADGLATAQQLGEALLMTGAFTASELEDALTSQPDEEFVASDASKSAEIRSAVNDFRYVVKTVYGKVEDDQMVLARAPDTTAPEQSEFSSLSLDAKPLMSNSTPASPLLDDAARHPEGFRSLASPSTTTPCTTMTSTTFCGKTSYTYSYTYS